MSDYSTPAKRSRPTRSELLREPREEIVERCLMLQGVIEQQSAKQQSDDLVQLKETNEKLRAESSQREGILVMRLTAKEQEVQDLLAQLHDTKHSLCPGSSQLQSMLLDPAVNLLFESFRKQLDESKAQLKQAQDDLAAYKFTPDSHIGKRLMAKCRLLLNENEELGRTISSGSVAKLESTIAIEKKLSQEMRKAEKDAEYALYEWSDDMEGMQSTIYQLQQSLKEMSEQLHEAQEENRRLRGATLPPGGGGATAPLTETLGPGHGTPEGGGATTPAPVKQRTDSNSEELNRLKRTAPPATTNAPRLKSRHTDKADASTERTNYKSGARNRSAGSHGNQDRAKGNGGGRSGHHVRQGAGDPSSESRTASVPTTRQDESSNGNGRHGNAESVAMDTNDAPGSAEKLSRSSTNERENQRPRTGSKADSAATSELANGLVGKHSTLTDSGQKV